MIRKYLFIVLACSLFMGVPACQGVAPIPPTPNNEATVTTEMKNSADIKLSDNRKTFTYHLADRFTIFLDDEQYPVRDLTCKPGDIIGYISNGSLRGPDLYPIMFESVKEGQCRLKDHDFQVDIIVKP